MQSTPVQVGLICATICTVVFRGSANIVFEMQPGLTLHLRIDSDAPFELRMACISVAVAARCRE